MGSSEGNSWALRAAGMGENPVEEGPAGSPQSFQRGRRLCAFRGPRRACRGRAASGTTGQGAPAPLRRDSAAAPQPAISPTARAGPSWKGAPRCAAPSHGRARGPHACFEPDQTRHLPGARSLRVRPRPGPAGLLSPGLGAPGAPRPRPLLSPTALAFAARSSGQAQTSRPAGPSSGRRRSTLGAGRSRRGLPGSGRTPAPPGSRPDSG